MSYWIINVWKKHQLKIIVVASILTILLLWMMNDGTPGTYSKSYCYVPTLSGNDTDSKKRPIVSQSKGELECRRVMEKLFKRPFPNRRPLFLLNNITGKKLEIDCCNEDVQIGVEYNGRQHYEYIKGMHKNY